ncbi:MAG: hypothetical protein NZ890_03830, partial [Myxococcota bacterium]|nr:hypothetical protein [Myxococcota bacterium]
REFELDADEALIRREEDRLVIEPVRRQGLLATLAALPVIEEDFPDVDAGLPHGRAAGHSVSSASRSSTACIGSAA